LCEKLVGIGPFGLAHNGILLRTRNERISEAAAEPDEYIVIGCAVCDAEERVHIYGKVFAHLVDQTCINGTDPWMIVTAANGVIEFDVAAQVTKNGARKADRIAPLHALAAAVRLIKNVDPCHSEQGNATRQDTARRYLERRLPHAIAEMIHVGRHLQ